MMAGGEQSAWVLAFRRFARDPVGVISAVIVLCFFGLALATSVGWLAADWQVQKAVGFAVPSLLNSGTQNAEVGKSAAAPALSQTAPRQLNEYDLLAPVLAQLRMSSIPDDLGVIDPLAQTLAQLRETLPSKVPANKAPESVAVQTVAPTALATSLAWGADKWGRDVRAKVLKGTQVSLLVGFASAVLATAIGVLLGAFAGYFGGKVDLFFNWLYSVFNAIPNILLILAIAAVLQTKGIVTVIVILGVTGWSSVFRLVRAEYLKHRTRDYVRAAQAIGASHFRKMFVHILPNISHVILVNLSLLVVLFIKSEVILSFLGFGVPVDTVSWGSILNEAQNEVVLGLWWQLLSTTVLMAILVTAFSLFTDALRDALDPKLK